MTEEEELPPQCGDRQRRPGDWHSTWKDQCLEMGGKHLCVRGALVLSEKAESCSLLSDGSERALKLENGKSSEGRVGRTQLKGSWQEGVSSSPIAFFPVSQGLGMQLWGGARSIPGCRNDCREHIPGKGKECAGRKEEEEQCPNTQSSLLSLTGIWSVLSVCGAQPCRAAAP